jgi:hypothetical protein
MPMTRNRTTVQKLIVDFVVEKRDVLKCELQTLVYNGMKFSITADEWTEISNRRYLNVTLHNKRLFKLGLVKIAGSCNAEKTQELVEKKLSEIGLKFKDIVTVMQKHGRLISAESQHVF